MLRADELRRWLIVGSAGTQAETARGIPVGTDLQTMERKLIEATLQQFHGHRGKTAQALGIGVRTLANKLRGYGYPPRAREFARAA